MKGVVEKEGGTLSGCGCKEMINEKKEKEENQ